MNHQHTKWSDLTGAERYFLMRQLQDDVRTLRRSLWALTIGTATVLASVIVYLLW